MTTEDVKNEKPTAEDEKIDKTERTKEEELTIVLNDVERAQTNEKTTDDKTEGAQTNEEPEEEQSPGLCRRIGNRLWQFYNNNDFICQIVVAILLARAYPPLGADYLQPQITSTWIAVIFIFGTCIG
jgi:hypothetical protein